MRFQQGLSGLNAAAKSLDVIGNNIANSSTVGFKGSQAQFADVYANSLNGASTNQAGIGTKIARIAQQFTQGGIEGTGNSLDLAINGGGFFRMELGGTAQYTRTGQFELDKEGFIVNAQNAKLTGYMADEAGILAKGTPLPIKINTADLPPVQTTKVNYTIKLDSNTKVPTLPFDTKNPQTYSHIEPIDSFDSLGNKQVLETYYVKTSPGVWEVYAGNNGTEVRKVQSTAAAFAVATDPLATDMDIVTAAWADVAAEVVALDNAITVDAAALMADLSVDPVLNAAKIATLTATTATAQARRDALDAAYVAATTPGSNEELAVNAARAIVGATPASVAAAAAAGVPAKPVGRMVFDALGNLDGANMLLQVPPRTPPFTVSMPIYPATGAVSPFSMELSYKAQQYAGRDAANPASSVSQKDQDGYTSGQMTRFNIGKNGEIRAEFNNGQAHVLAQVVLANFANPNGLTPLGNNSWAASVSSGQQLIGTPDSGTFGVMESSAVEASNVDLTAELVNMITAQRAYQANAQTIKTQDQVLQTLVNLR
ncbi:MAG TPA: flagellar hook protein FlgE [Burkholderiaceae bacterium]